jgi:hypothetical protein
MYAVELAFRNETATAREQAQRALDDARALRQPTLEIGALYALAATTARTDPEGALALLHTSRELGRYYHNEAEQGATLGLLAYVEAAHGSHRNAVEAMRELAVTQLYSPTVWPGYYLGISAFSRVGRPDLVALCEGNSRAVVRQTAYLPYSELHAEETAEARAILGDEQFEQLTGRGAAMTRDDFNAMLLREIDAILDDMHEAGTP